MAARKVLVFHVQEDVRRWIADALHSGNGTFGVVADTSNMPEALVLSRFHQPDIIVIGFRESTEMTDFLYGLRAASPNARLIGYLEEDQEDVASAPGYDAFVTHKRKTTKLLEAFQRASAYER